MKELQIHCQYSRLVDPAKLVSLRGNLKGYSVDQQKKLETSILRNGILFPAFVYSDKGSEYLIDGVLRARVLLNLQRAGYEFAGMPVVDVKADDRQHALALVLAASSHFAKLVKAEALAFIASLHWTDWISELAIGINIREAAPDKSAAEEKKKKVVNYELSFSASQHSKFLQAIEKIRSKLESPEMSVEDIVFRAVSTSK